ncbi:MAG: hypothetical protein CMJ83_07340 [Planctomycetes bacterium]|nr:hypothetical protein [Planctomycetota bacterium]
MGAALFERRPPHFSIGAHTTVRATISAPIEGVLVEIAVREGQVVAVGDVLARMDDSVARASVRAAEAATKKEAALAHAETEIKLARSYLKRLEVTNRAGATTPAAIDQAAARLDQARSARDAMLEQRVAALRSLELEKTRLARLVVKAPFAGRVLRIHSRAGESLTTQSKLLFLASLQTLDAEINLPVEFYGKLVKGQEYSLSAGAPVNATLRGRLRVIEPTIDSTSLTFRCVFEIENPEERLPSGFAVRFTPNP